MTIEQIYLLIFAGFGFLLIILLWLVIRLSLRLSWLQSHMEEGQDKHEKLERVLRADMADNRRETNETLRQNREEFNSAIQNLGKTLNDRSEQSSRTLEEKLLGFQSLQLKQSEQLRLIVDDKLNQVQTDAREGRTEQSTSLKNFGEQLTGQLQHLTQGNNEGLEILRQTLETKLSAIQTDNSQKLEQMRLTVDEKLHNTLEQRLGDSFKLVSDRLEQVHKGLGEMQALASGVGDLKKVLSNVKVRGTWGEVQLDNLLEQVLSPEQYAKNVVTRPNSNERVEFAIKLPGRNDGTDRIWLPIDAKFPLEDYQKLMEAQDMGDVVKMEESRKALESRIRDEAKTLRDKYLEPPFTTDFGLLFLPIEGLYAEVISRPGLSDYLQRECRVTVTGPTTLTAILNSLQMGFRTLAIEKRSSEVWQVLGAVKTEFGKFGEVLAKTKKKLDEARNTIDEAEKRSRSMDRKLRQVESLPVKDAQLLLDDLPIVDN